MKTLSISLYNRPDYTSTLFSHLHRCFGIEDYKIYIFCEPGNQEVIQLAKEFRPDQSEVVVNNSRFGCNTNIFQCLACGFSLNDYHIHFEDDTIPGKDCLKYFEWARQFGGDKNLYTVSAYVNNNNEWDHYLPMNKNYGNVSARQWFTPWGWATWIDRFEEMRAGWDFQGSHGSWDTTVNLRLRGDRLELFPHVSRCQNIGAEMGTHVPSADWHKNHQFNEHWIETDEKYPETFTPVQL